MTRAVWVLWPLGLVLVLAQGLGGVLSTPVFLLLDALYAGAALLLLRAAGGADRPAVALALTGPGLFALAAPTGVPTATRPVAMLLNGAVLLAVAVTLLVAATLLAVRLGGGLAALAVVALAVGSAGWLLNLVARWAVVASGAAPLQAAVEQTYWQAYSYLAWLPGEPTSTALLLVLTDLLQLCYVVLTYLGVAALATAAGRAGLVPSGATIGRVGCVLAAVTLAAAAVAPALPGAAWVAFVLTIPFLSTLLPHALGVGILRRGALGPVG